MLFPPKRKKFCPESKGVDERTIERAFVESYRLLCQNNKDVLDEFMKRTEETLSESNAGKRLAKAEREIHALEVKKNKLVDMRLEDTIDKETYDRKYLDLSSQIEQLQKECESLQDAAETESTMRKRVATFRQTLEQNEVLDTFDRHIFESIVEKVIVGGYDSNGNKDPYMIVFVYKTGFKTVWTARISSRFARIARRTTPLLFCVPMLLTRLNPCVPILATTHVECVLQMTRKSN